MTPSGIHGPLGRPPFDSLAWDPSKRQPQPGTDRHPTSTPPLGHHDPHLPQGLDRSEGDGKLRKLGSGARRRAEAAVAEALRYDESLQHYWTRVEDKVAHGCINAAGGSAAATEKTE